MKIRIHESLLIACDAETLRLYDIEGGEPTLVAERRRPGALSAFTEDPTGERVTEVRNGLFARSFTAPGQKGHWAEQHSSVGLYDLSLAEVACYDVGRRLDDPTLALSPDGARLASVTYGAGVVVFDARTGEVQLEHPGQIGSGVSWSPDGRAIAAGDTDQSGGALYLLDLEGEAGSDERLVRRELPKPSSRTPLYDSPYDSVFSPDGGLVVFSNAAWGIRGVTAYDPTGGEERWAVRFEMSEENEEAEFWDALDLAFAADGAVVLAGIEEGVRAFRANDGAPLTTLPCEGASSLYFAPDDIRRRVWFTREGELAWEGYPDDWA